MINESDKAKTVYCLEDFEFIQGKNGESMSLGVGSFGAVKLVKHKKSQATYALKIVEKKIMLLI